MEGQKIFCSECIASNFASGVCDAEETSPKGWPCTVCTMEQKYCVIGYAIDVQATLVPQQEDKPVQKSAPQVSYGSGGSSSSGFSSSPFSQIPIPSICSPATRQTTPLSTPFSQQEPIGAYPAGDTGQFHSHASAVNRVTSLSQRRTRAFGNHTMPSLPPLRTGSFQDPKALKLPSIQSIMNPSPPAVSQDPTSTSVSNPFGWLPSSSAFPGNGSLEVRRDASPSNGLNNSGTIPSGHMDGCRKSGSEASSFRPQDASSTSVSDHHPNSHQPAWLAKTSIPMQATPQAMPSDRNKSETQQMLADLETKLGEEDNARRGVEGKGKGISRG